MQKEVKRAVIAQHIERVAKEYDYVLVVGVNPPKEGKPHDVQFLLQENVDSKDSLDSVGHTSYGMTVLFKKLNELANKGEISASSDEGYAYSLIAGLLGQIAIEMPKEYLDIFQEATDTESGRAAYDIVQERYEQVRKHGHTVQSDFGAYVNMGDGGKVLSIRDDIPMFIRYLTNQTFPNDHLWPKAWSLEFKKKVDLLPVRERYRRAGAMCAAYMDLLSYIEERGNREAR